MGLVEQEWIDTLATVDPEDVIFLDFVETGNKLAAELREEVGTDKLFLFSSKYIQAKRKICVVQVTPLKN